MMTWFLTTISRRQKAEADPFTNFSQNPFARAEALDRQADFELQRGRHAAAERLSREAALLRDGSP